jgi:hypothetical protein
LVVEKIQKGKRAGARGDRAWLASLDTTNPMRNAVPVLVGTASVLCVLVIGALFQFTSYERLTWFGLVVAYVGLGTLLLVSVAKDAPVASRSSGPASHALGLPVLIFLIALSVVPVVRNHLESSSPRLSSAIINTAGCREPGVRFTDLGHGSFSERLLCASTGPRKTVLYLRAEGLGRMLSVVDAGSSRSAVWAELRNFKSGDFFLPLSTSTYGSGPDIPGWLYQWSVSHDDEVGFEYIIPPYSSISPIRAALTTFRTVPEVAWWIIGGIATFVFGLMTSILADFVKQKVLSRERA